MLVTQIRADGTVDLGAEAQALGYTPGKLVRVVRTSADTLIVALHDEPVMIEATGQRLPAPQKQRALRRQGEAAS